MDHDDELLAELGQGTPFPVDWQAYREQLMTRLTRTEAARRRHGFFLFAVGTAAGVAATLALALLFGPAVEPTPLGPTVAEKSVRQTIADRETPVPVSAPAPAVRLVVRTTGQHGRIKAVVGDSPVETRPDPIKPFVRRTGNGEIRFEGFSKPGAGEPGFMVAEIR
jgi:hypothetical protein